MERSIRIGKDFNVLWSIHKVVDGERLPYELAGKELELQYRTPYGIKKVKEWVAEGNTIIWTFRGKEQKALGLYGLILTENRGKDGMVTVDTCKAFKLVAHSCEETEGSGNDVVIDVVVLESEVAFAPVATGGGGGSYDDTAIKEDIAELQENDRQIVEALVQFGEAVETLGKNDQTIGESIASLQEKDEEIKTGLAQLGEKVAELEESGTGGGTSPSFTSVEVSVDDTTGDPRAEAEIDGNTLKIDFFGLKGEQGEVGPVGPQGEQGIQGPQGNSGYQGAAGELEVVNNLEDGGGASALSAGMGKLLYEMLTIPQTSDIEVVIQPESWYVGQYIDPHGQAAYSANYSVTKVPIKLQRRDRLEVTTQVNGVSVISEVISLGMSYAALVIEQNNNAVAEKTYVYSAEKEIEVVVTIKHTASYKIIKYPGLRTPRFNILEESIDELTYVSENIVNELQLSNSSNILSQSDFTAVPGIPAANNLWAIIDSSYASFTRACKGGDTFFVQGNLANGSYVCFLQSPYNVGVNGGVIIYATGYSGNGVKIAAGDTGTFVAPDDAQRIVIIQYSGGKNFYPATISTVQNTSVLSLLKDDVGKLTSATGVKKPSSIALNKTDYISTTRNYILKEVLEDSKSYFLYSNDLGVSWQKTENTIGDIQFVHWFSNGTCLICGTGKAYTTRDFITFTESEVYDKDGSVYTPNARTFFRLGNYNSEYRTLNDREVVVWNDYGTESGYVSRVWYSDDYGKTLRCILKGSEMDVRHFHRTLLHDNTLWITSGDDGAQCKLISGHYENGEWDFNVVASGNTYKIGQLDIIPPYARMVTDYTNGNLPTGLIKCPLNHLSDASYLEYLVKLDGNPPVSSYWEDAAGNRIILPDGIGYKKLWYARGDMKFSLISITCDDNVAPMTLIGPNYNGDCIVNGVAGYGAASALHLNDKRYMLSDAFKAEGVVDFGKSLF